MAARASSGEQRNMMHAKHISTQTHHTSNEMHIQCVLCSVVLCCFVFFSSICYYIKLCHYDTSGPKSDWPWILKHRTHQRSDYSALFRTEFAFARLVSARPTPTSIFDVLYRICRLFITVTAKSDELQNRLNTKVRYSPRGLVQICSIAFVRFTSIAQLTHAFCLSNHQNYPTRNLNTRRQTAYANTTSGKNIISANRRYNACMEYYSIL